MAYRDQLKSPISTFVSPKGRFEPLILISNLNDYRIISRLFHHLHQNFYKCNILDDFPFGEFKTEISGVSMALLDNAM